MNNPQKENGYTAIANELLDNLCKTRIAGRARQVLDFIIRKTYGFNKKEDHISLSQFVEGTTLKKTYICREIKSLKAMNIIMTQKGNEKGDIYRFNKQYQTWKPLPKKVTLPKKVISVTQKGNLPLPNWGTTKDNITKDNTKDIRFELFWNNYPNRNGKKFNKIKTRELFKELKEKDKKLIIKAVDNYKNSEMIQKGIGIKDPNSFISNKNHKQYWKDWIVPENNKINKKAKIINEKAISCLIGIGMNIFDAEKYSIKYSYQHVKKAVENASNIESKNKKNFIGNIISEIEKGEKNVK